MKSNNYCREKVQFITEEFVDLMFLELITTNINLSKVKQFLKEQNLYNIPYKMFLGMEFSGNNHPVLEQVMMFVAELNNLKGANIIRTPKMSCLEFYGSICKFENDLLVEKNIRCLDKVSTIKYTYCNSKLVCMEIFSPYRTLNFINSATQSIYFSYNTNPNSQYDLNIVSLYLNVKNNRLRSLYFKDDILLKHQNSSNIKLYNKNGDIIKDYGWFKSTKPSSYAGQMYLESIQYDVNAEYKNNKLISCNYYVNELYYKTDMEYDIKGNISSIKHSRSKCGIKFDEYNFCTFTYIYDENSILKNIKQIRPNLVNESYIQNNIFSRYCTWDNHDN